LGLAFKGRPETSDLRGSLVIPLIEQIKATYPGVRLIGYDPAVGEADTVNLGLVYASTVAKAFEGADAIIFQNNNESFGLFDMLSLSQSLKPDAVIYDMWNQFEPETLTLRSDVLYFGYGTHALIGQRRESINLSPPIGFPPTFDEQVFPPRAYARTGG
jgi:UDP-N-acetyl-D-mannosaminuronic acid dehydrogenase